MDFLPDKLIPLIYLIAIAAIGAGLHLVGVPPEMTGMIVGAGLTRVKVGSPPGVKKNVEK